MKRVTVTSRQVPVVFVKTKRIKAWAVVSARGRLWAGYADALIFRTKKAAEFMATEGERVVPVVIEIEEGK